MYSNNVTKENKSAQVKLKLADGTTKMVDREKAEDFIIENIDKLETKEFIPKGKRRTETES